MQLSKAYCCIFLLSCSVNVSSASNVNHACDGIHTWHTIRTDKGTWHGNLEVVNLKAYFVNENCEKIHSFDVTPDEPFTYGMGVISPDFNLTYTLTVAKDVSYLREEKGYSIKKFPLCHYLISAYKPMVPQINTVELNQSVCTVIPVQHAAVDFYVSDPYN